MKNRRRETMKQLVIFDLDGTLLNTIADLATATNEALRCCGFPQHPIGDYCRFVGNGIAKLFERALPAEARTDENIARMRTCFLPYYNEHNADDTTPYEGVVELLSYLSARGIRLAVASNKYQAATEKLVAHYFPHIPFVAVLGQREGVPVKPDPAIVHEILAVAGVSARDTLYIGDSGVDMRTAQAAGVESVGVTWGFRGRDELLQSEACCLVDRADEIVAIVEK